MADLDEVGGGAAGQGVRGALRWTAHMSSLMLKKMVELIAQGVKTDKGFKEVHLNQVARTLSDHYGIEISGTQVYNHLRKWRSRWVRISRLKDLSGALWDDQNNMIVLEEEHYMGHAKDHPKDVEFLNVPLENYVQMSIIFGNGQATGRFAMGSNEPLGAPADGADSGLGQLDGDAEGVNEVPARGGSVAGGDNSNAPHFNDNVGASSSSGKRKRTPIITEEEGALLTNMTSALHDVASAIRSTAHTEVHPDLYQAVMDLPGFSEDQLDLALAHLCANKSSSLIYIQKNEERRARWVSKFLADHHPDCI
ncbi:uncharacterized protein LOC102717165 [Oryza brachyantha]|nr:uncharacterized protein LOC102717165 [Oryza brachyantha]